MPRPPTEADRIVEKFKKSGCSYCSEREPCCLTAHHLYGKSFSIGKVNRRLIDPNVLRDELKKCICVCLNCHTKLHAGKLNIADE